jgi:hypothetical protein
VPSLEQSAKPIRADPQQPTERSTSGHGGRNSAEALALLWPDRFIWVHGLVQTLNMLGKKKYNLLF